MFDRIFSAILTFSVLLGSTLAIASTMLDQPTNTQAAIIKLPLIEITGKRTSACNKFAQSEISHTSF